MSTEHTQPSLLDLVETHTAAHWPEWQRVAKALEEKGRSFHEDAVKLRANPDINEQVTWDQVYKIVSTELFNLARDLRNEAQA